MKLTTRVRMTPIEIGTSMLARPALNDRQADWKKVMPANRAQGAATMADSHIIRPRVAGPNSCPNSPAHRGTENIMAFMAPKPATPRATSRRRPSRSTCLRPAAGSKGVTP